MGGSSIRYRSITHYNAKAFLELLRTLDSESKFMMFEEGERQPTEEEIAIRLETNAKDGHLTYGAFDGDTIAGYISVMRGGFNRIKHSAYVVIGVRKNYAGQGIATKLLGHADEWARDNDISKLELTVMKHNPRAHDLYLRCGYEDEGIKRRSVYVDGVYYDEYYMGKIIIDDE